MLNLAMSIPSTHAFDAPLTVYQQQAEVVFAALLAGDSDAAWRFKWMHPRFKGRPVTDVSHATLDLEDARLLIAKEHYFQDWSRLESFTRAVCDDESVRRFELSVEATIHGDTETLDSLLKQHPALVNERSLRTHNATLLHYLGANGVEEYRQRTPPSAVEVAKLLLEAGAAPDALADMYDHQCTTMSLLVSSSHPYKAGLQVALAETLLDYGAALEGPGTNWSSTVLTALQFGYLETARALVNRGGKVENLVIAAGLGRVDDTIRLLPSAESLARHQALALAAQLGQLNTTRLLLDAGENPNRLNPEGYHAHSTPLHQAVWAGQLDIVKLLVVHGARKDIRDTLYDGTALDWANHGKRRAIAEYLQQG